MSRSRISSRSGLLRASAVLVLSAALALVVVGCGSGGGTIEKLFSPTGNRLDVYDLETDESTVLIPSERYNVNGQVCPVPTGDGRFLMGEDTNQSDGARQGWGIFSKDGTLKQKILEPETDGEAKQIEPYGCFFDEDERLFTTDVGDENFDSKNGKFIVYFPPDYDTYCVLALDLRVAGSIASDPDGNLYITETAPPGDVLKFAGPFPANADECDSVKPERSQFIKDDEVQTTFGALRQPNGNWYVSSVFLPTAIREYDADGTFVRTIAEGDSIGNPAGIALASDGTLYYADLGLVQEPGQLPGPGDKTGTVRKITFDADGNPSEPEIMNDGLDYPDAVSVLEVKE